MVKNVYLEGSLARSQSKFGDQRLIPVSQLSQRRNSSSISGGEPAPNYRMSFQEKFKPKSTSKQRPNQLNKHSIPPRLNKFQAGIYSAKFEITQQEKQNQSGEMEPGLLTTQKRPHSRTIFEN